MPAYNEEDGITDAVQAVALNVLDRVSSSELVVINDGSRDATGRILDTLAASDPRVRVVHKPNGGHGPAIITGLAAARGEYVFLVDSDNQVPLDSFPALWARVTAGEDAAFGVRRVRHDARIRIVLTRLIRVSLSLLFGVRLHDANVPFKLFRRSLWERARRIIPDDTLAPSLFVAVFAARSGERIAFVDVEHKDRETGTVSIRRWKLIRFCARAFRQLIAFRAALAST
ncbi:MAG: glycosyltransferase family 2 protein [Gemmatimonadota bacterium]